MVVTLYYEWPIYVTLLGNNLQDLNGSKRLLVATSVFRTSHTNEPARHQRDDVVAAAPAAALSPAIGAACRRSNSR